MKIAVVVNELNVRGGTHKQVLRLCQYLKMQGIDFVLCTKWYDQEKTFDEFGEFDVIHISKTRTKQRKYNVFLEKILGENSKELYELIPNDVDIINVHDMGLDYLIWIAKKHKKKVILQLNDFPRSFGTRNVFSGENKNSFFLKVKAVIGKFKFRYFIKGVDKITVNVTKNKERVLKYLKKNSEVFYCGVDKNIYLKKHFYDLEKKQQINILSAGVFFPYRNYETLIHVVDKLKNEHVSVCLDIIGSTAQDPTYAEEIKTLIKEKKLETMVKIHGQVDETTYNELYNKADIFAFINIDQSWGLAVFEAMSCGLPVIVSNSVGAVELLHDEIDSIIVDPKNIDEISRNIYKLLKDEHYYNKISKNAIDAVSEFTWDELYCSKMLELFKAVYEECKD